MLDGIVTFSSRFFIHQYQCIIQVNYGLIGKKGHRVILPNARVILPNARVMVHQSSGGAEGQASVRYVKMRKKGWDLTLFL